VVLRRLLQRDEQATTALLNYTYNFNVKKFADLQSLAPTP
jgi:hypothetical protein